jgi:hypothetical protein
MSLHVMSFKDMVVTILFFVVIISVVVLSVMGVIIAVNTLYNGFTACRHMQQ